MERPSIESLQKQGLNRYEAVIVAAKHARFLNTKRLRQLELMEQDPSIDIDSRKITMKSLKEVLDGKVKFNRPDSM
jgi:DNA-directed RNA polymerase omega subunit